MTNDPQAQHENPEINLLMKSAFELAQALQINRLLIQVDHDRDTQMMDALRGSERIIWATRGPIDLLLNAEHNDFIVRIPEPALTRISQLRMSLFLALLNTDVELDEPLICLYDISGSAHVDTLTITTPRRHFPWLLQEDVMGTRRLPALRHFERLIDIALRLAAEGREGRPIGTIFVLGEPASLAPYLRQLNQNPCSGHPPHERDIHNPSFMETLREFAALDGAFVISHTGTVESAGTYLDAPTDIGTLQRGYGARHAAAVAITTVTRSFAIVISESSGTVTVFYEGRVTLALERPDDAPQRALT
jgi:DNA integrity scanning protein DisA with diadenylate cyclase activity